MAQHRLPRIWRRIGPGATHEETTTPSPYGHAADARLGPAEGSLNRRTVELRQLMGALAGDIDYQERFSNAFRRRRLHPSTEMRVWEYVVGKPAERVQLSADVTMNQRLERERELFASLTIQQLEELGRESQALTDRALAMARANGLKAIPATTISVPVEADSEPAEQSSGTDGDEA